MRPSFDGAEIKIRSGILGVQISVDKAATDIEVYGIEQPGGIQTPLRFNYFPAAVFFAFLEVAFPPDYLLMIMFQVRYL